MSPRKSWSTTHRAQIKRRDDKSASNLRTLAVKLGRRRFFTARRSWRGASALESLIVEASVAVPRAWLAAWKSQGWIEEYFEAETEVYRYSFTEAGREVVRVAA